MKKNKPAKLISTLLCVVVIAASLPLSVFAAHTCPECSELIDGDLYCHSCYKCENCVDVCPVCETCTDCSGANLCSSCNTCDNCTAVCETCNMCENCSGSEICDTCTGEMGEVICLACAIDSGYHCPDCGDCYFEVGDWCDDCGRCYNCVDKCADCSEAIGHSVCVECAADAGYHCPECGDCYFKVGDWCDDCGRCYNCVDKCPGCSDAIGHSVCVECGIDAGNHCPGCESCYFDVGDWCDICGLCYNCTDKCEGCSGEHGESVCVDCAIANGWHCPECGGCYAEIGEYCSECGKCEGCIDICTECVSDGICMDCAVEQGLHCGGCYACSKNAVICEGCGVECTECAEDFCETCNLCSECTTVCPNCNHCSECAEICPGCGVYCTECSDFCDDCGLCEECCRANAETNGCDCDDWVCVESIGWDEHIDSVHTEGGTHTVKASGRWIFDTSNHWHPCMYCSEAEHYTSKAAHTYDDTGKCTVCGYDKNAKIQIIKQPQDVSGIYVSNASSDYSHNTVHFEVAAYGNSELTYKWYHGCYNAKGELVKYYLDPTKDKFDTEDFEGPEIDVVIPTDACYYPAYYFCVISDEDGNTVTSNFAEVYAKHNYVVVDSKTADGHYLRCAGENCEADTVFKKHCDENDDYICDVCGYETEHILKQINIHYDNVYEAFRVGENVSTLSERLKVAYRIYAETSHAYISNSISKTYLCNSTTGYWANIASTASDATVNSTDMYAVCLSVTCTMKDDTVLPAAGKIANSDIICLNGTPLTYGEDYCIKTGSFKQTVNQAGNNVYEFVMYIKTVPSTDTLYNISVQNGTAFAFITDRAVKTALPGNRVYLYTEEYDYEDEVFSHWECTKGNVTIKNAKHAQDASFVMPSSDVEFKAVYVKKTVTSKISGNVKSFGTDSDVITILLYRSGETSPAYTFKTTGNSTTCLFPKVSAGDYTMKVSKNNHVTRDYSITVGETDIVQDIDIYEPGDVNGDGSITVEDYSKVVNTALSHSNTVSDDTTLTSNYSVAVSDMNSDGIVDVLDCMLVERKSH